MKKILMICLALVMGTGICAAQKAGDKKTVTTVFVTDIDCEHCAKKILNNVPALGKGIKDVKVDVPTKEVTVVYDGTKTNDANIVKGFASIKVKAEPKAAVCAEKACTGDCKGTCTAEKDAAKKDCDGKCCSEKAGTKK